MEAADRHRIGEDQVAAEKHPDRRRPAAHVDDRDPQIHLVLDEARQTRGIGADDQRLDFEMRAPDRGGEVAHARRGGGLFRFRLPANVESVQQPPANARTPVAVKAPAHSTAGWSTRC